jgi:hypothetical protein
MRFSEKLIKFSEKLINFLLVDVKVILKAYKVAPCTLMDTINLTLKVPHAQSLLVSMIAYLAYQWLLVKLTTETAGFKFS